jgi:hypothetical protein
LQVPAAKHLGYYVGHCPYKWHQYNKINPSAVAVGAQAMYNANNIGNNVEQIKVGAAPKHLFKGLLFSKIKDLIINGKE